MLIIKKKWFNFIIIILVGVILIIKINRDRNSIIEDLSENSTKHSACVLDSWEYTYKYGLLNESTEEVRECFGVGVREQYEVGRFADEEEYLYICQILEGGFSFTSYLESHTFEDLKSLFGTLHAVEEKVERPNDWGIALEYGKIYCGDYDTLLKLNMLAISYIDFSRYWN